MSETASSYLAAAEANRRWVLTEGREGEPAHWPGEEVRGLDLTGATLAGAMLIQAAFVEVRLAGADLSRANAGGATFDAASAAGAMFIKTQLTQASFAGADLRGADFTKAILDKATVADATLDGAALSGASCVRANLSGASLRGVSLVGTDLSGADLSATTLTNAKFSETHVDAETRLGCATDLDMAVVDSIIVGPHRFSGEAARAWLRRQADRERWTTVEFEAWLLSKMSSALVRPAARQLGLTVESLRETAKLLGTVFDTPGHAAAEYRRILGPPIAQRLVAATGTFSGSTQQEFRIPLWPDLTFVVNEDANGVAWGAEFVGGAGDIPQCVDDFVPWHWTLDRLKQVATSVTIEEQWTYDAEAIFTFAGSTTRYRARFDLGLLQAWARVE
jgi:hypothetical protein